ncbi:MAG TPA: hypothetical protein VK550_12815 [Polyangiaceae bacterium]|jgi:hypothetical protein|nr:hypothetical protein [Polyangiaceae bacterium]
MDNQHRDPHDQLRALYRSLLERQSNFDEFKQLLTLYPESVSDTASESEEAAYIRARLNFRISEWVNGNFDGLSVDQVLQWRNIVVEERFNIALSPWRESSVW